MKGFFVRSCFSIAASKCYWIKAKIYRLKFLFFKFLDNIN